MHTFQMPTPPKLVDLTPQQVRAAQLLASGLSYSKVADELSVGRCTLYRWRQEPHFLVYYHQLLKELADQATARSLQMLAQTQDLIQNQLANAEVPVKLRSQIALRLMSIFTPRQLQPIQNLPDDAHSIACSQYLQYWKTCGVTFPADECGSEHEANHILHQQQLEEAEAFDRKYSQTPMNQNEPK